MKKIYLDYAATTPVKEAVVSCMMPYFSDTDPNKAVVRKTSSDFMNLLHANEGEFLFTSGGTHSDNALIRALAYYQRNQGKGNEIITSTIEHPAVYRLLEQLETEGFKIIYIPVSSEGVLDIEAFYSAVCDKTVLVTIMMINNELGTRQPVEAIGDFLKDKDILFHVDAVQALGSTVIDLNALHVDAASFSAHKIYAPKGCGAIYIKNKAMLANSLEIFFDQACDGYDNIPYIAGFGKALTLSYENFKESRNRRIALKEKLINGMLDLSMGIKVNGLPLEAESHPGIVNFFVPQMDGDSMVINYDFNGIAISAGSACSSGALSASHVIKAIGYNEQKAKKCIRMTIGDYTTEEDIERVIEVTREMLKGIKYAR